jgi:hypothetical protein
MLSKQNRENGADLEFGPQIAHLSKTLHFA